MEKLENQQVLVTGAGGFIGSHLVEKLVFSGAKVKAYIHYNSRGDIGLLKYIPREILTQVEIVPGDLLDLSALIRQTKNVQKVFHLGALISIPYSYIHPYQVVETNVLGTMNVLNACKINEVDRMIHTSTSEVYGTAQYVPINENHPLHAQSPYSASKIAADKCVESFSCSYQLPVVTVRPFNTFGPRQSARAVIPVIISQALTTEKIKLGNVQTKRDFTYVDDTVKGFINAAISEDVIGQTINLGTGKEMYIYEICKLVSEILQKPFEIIEEHERMRPEKSEVLRLISDNSLAKKKLNWYPEVSFEEGVRRTIFWMKQNLHVFKIGQYEY